MKVNIKKLPKSEIEIEGELSHDVFESYFVKALHKIGEKVEIDGFRKGKVPEKVLLDKVGEMHVLEEMAELALSEHYPKILEEEKVDAVGRPEISITKLARRNPLGFKIKTAVLPPVTLPDYKNIAKKIIAKAKSEEKDTTVSEEELENTILDIRKSRAPKIHMKDGAKEHVHREGEEPHETPTSEGVGVPTSDESQSVGKELPDFNDEFVKLLGPFENVEDFKSKLRENIKLEKENQKREKIRVTIIEKIIEESKLDVPEILINAELDKILYKMQSDIAQMGLKFEDYMKHLNKTTEDLRKDFRADAEKKSKLSLVLHEIGKAEKIEADAAQVENEVAMILEHYKDADPERAKAHAENVLVNEAIFQFLENQN